MRGALVYDFDVLFVLGIIPAYAGSTSFGVAAEWAVWDHPRVCGEHYAAAVKTKSVKGSSPRMRGALVHRHP